MKKTAKELKYIADSSDPMAAESDDEIDETKEIEIDEMILKQEKKLYENKLKELRLCEKIGINGEIMLYPKKEKEKKWYNGEYEAMVNELYEIKEYDEFKNVGFTHDSFLIPTKFTTKKSGNLR